MINYPKIKMHVYQNRRTLYRFLHAQIGGVYWESIFILAVVLVVSLGVTFFGYRHHLIYASDLETWRADAPETLRTYWVVATAYSSDPAQTDDTPCITADGFDLCRNDLENVIAANFLPLGTKVRIPQIYDDRIFVVHDRMNERYGEGRIDIWMYDRDRAVAFGVKTLKLEIIEWPGARIY